MIRQLCGHLDARRLYVTIARAIEEEVTDTNVAQKLVQTFNWILLTAKETTSVREELLTTTPLSEMPCEDTPGTDGTPLFLELIEPWLHVSFAPVVPPQMHLAAHSNDAAHRRVLELHIPHRVAPDACDSHHSDDASWCSSGSPIGGFEF